MNNVNIIGRLTKDPETRTTPGGSTVVSLRVAVERPKKDGADQTPHYFTVIAWNGQADNAAQHLVKGREIGVSGRLEHREWKTDDDQPRSAVEIVANNIDYLRPAASNEAQNEADDREEVPAF
jgi:single-strand DNA-binding protein